jgi:hypothetical protein
LRFETAIASTVIFWASAFVGIRVAVQEYSAVELAAGRIIISALVFAAYAGFFGMRRPAPRDMPGLVALGVIGFAL